MTRTAQKALVCIGVALILLVGLTYYQSARAGCVTETTAPFFRDVSRALVQLSDTGGLTETTGARLRGDADRLDTLTDRCRWPW